MYTNTMWTFKIKSWNLNSVRKLQLKSETEILTVFKIVHHHLKSNLWTVSMRLFNHVVEVWTNTMWTLKIKSRNLNGVGRLQLKSETEILTVFKIVRHHLKSNLWTVSLRLYNHVVEVQRWYLKKFFLYCMLTKNLGILCWYAWHLILYMIITFYPFEDACFSVWNSLIEYEFFIWIKMHA